MIWLQKIFKMAIEKKLIHFDKKEDFNNRLTNNEILDSSIVFIKDTNTIYTHGEEYQWISWSYLKTDVPAGYSLFITADSDTWRDANGDIIFVKE